MRGNIPQRNTKDCSERWSQQFVQEMKKAEEKRCKCMMEMKRLAKMVHWPGDDGIEKIKSKGLKTWRTGGFYHQLLFKWKAWSVYSTLNAASPFPSRFVRPKKWFLVAVRNCRYEKANDLLLILHACDEVRNTQEFTKGGLCRTYEVETDILELTRCRKLTRYDGQLGAPRKL